MFYRFEKITPRITRIWDVSHTAIYLIEGSEGALLVDTGVGAGSLKAAVESLTAKPVTVLLTHGHVDHAMGAGEFDTVYLHSADKELYLDHSQLPVRMGYVQGAVHQGGDAELIAKVLAKHGGNRKAAAAELGISERTLYRKIKNMK